MTKQEYIDLISNDNLLELLTTQMMSNEIHSMAVAKVLMDKGFFTYSELQDEFENQIKLFVSRIVDKDPNYFNFEQ